MNVGDIDPSSRLHTNRKMEMGFRHGVIVDLHCAIWLFFDCWDLFARG